MKKQKTIKEKLAELHRQGCELKAITIIGRDVSFRFEEERRPGELFYNYYIIKVDTFAYKAVKEWYREIWEENPER